MVPGRQTLIGASGMATTTTTTTTTTATADILVAADAVIVAVTTDTATKAATKKPNGPAPKRKPPKREKRATPPRLWTRTCRTPKKSPPQTASTRLRHTAPVVEPADSTEAATAGDAEAEGAATTAAGRHGTAPEAARSTSPP